MGIVKRIYEKITFILGCRHSLANVMLCEDYAKQYGSVCEYHLIESNRSTIVSPAQFINETAVKPFETSMPDTYWMKFVNGSVIGGSSIVVSDENIILYDMLANRKIYNANMTDNGLLLLGGNPKHIGNRFIYNYRRKGITSLPSAISLACNMSNNYYHFMLQVAARFYLLSKTGLDKKIPLIVDEAVLFTPQMKEVIDVLNVDNRAIVSIKKNQLFRVKELYILSEPNVIVPNTFANSERRTENFAFDKNVLVYLKTTINDRISECDMDFPKRVFLSRKKCNKRRCNEEELMDILKQFGFKSIETDEMSISEQIALFSNAEHIIGGSGAAFTNLIYCKKSANATLFFTGHHNITCFSALGICLGVNTYYTYPETEGREIHMDYYRINPNTISNHLKSIYRE